MAWDKMYVHKRKTFQISANRSVKIIVPLLYVKHIDTTLLSNISNKDYRLTERRPLFFLFLDRFIIIIIFNLG